MRLSDIMSAANLAIYAEVGLVIFLVAFFAMAIRTFWPGQKNHYEELGRIPLSDAPVVPRDAAVSRHSAGPASREEVSQ